LISFWKGGVQINTLSFDSSNWDSFQDVEVRAVDDLVVRGFHKADLVASAPGYSPYLSTVSIADDNWVGVRVIESNGSTNVIEFKSGDFGLPQATALGAGLPFEDSYTVALSEQPTADVFITVQAQPTRTSQTGGIFAFSQQLLVSADDASFGATKQLKFTS